jgi:hypothetical protein
MQSTLSQLESNISIDGESAIQMLASKLRDPATGQLVSLDTVS